jgi:hypothetical protein
MKYMALYGDPSNLNQAGGRTTIQARVQNQYYQGALQADAAAGANVLNRGRSSLAQLADQTVDLGLLKGKADANTPIDDAWIARNIQADRRIAFGSSEYFALAKDPAARAFLQSGVNVIFAHNGEVIAVQDSITPADRATSPSAFDWLNVLAWIQRVMQAIVRGQ